MLLNKRGQVVFGICFTVTAIVALAGLLWVTDHINWVGDHYCFKSSVECFFGDAK